MSCRESRRAQYEKLFNSYEDEIAKLTSINQLTAKELNDSKDQVSMLQNTIKALQQENETLRQEIGKKSPAKFGRHLMEHHSKEVEVLRNENESLQAKIKELQTSCQTRLKDKEEHIFGHHRRFRRQSEMDPIDLMKFDFDSKDSGFLDPQSWNHSEVTSPCDSLPSYSSHKNPLDIICNEHLSDFNNETLPALESPGRYFQIDSRLSTPSSSTTATLLTPTKFINTQFQTPEKIKEYTFRTPTKVTPSKFRTPDKKRKISQICKISMNSRELPKNIKTRPLLQNQLLSLSKGRTFQLSSSGLSTLKQIENEPDPKSAIVLPVPLSEQNINTTPTKMKKEEDWKSPRKLQQINILRRKRVQTRSTTVTPRSRRKQII